MAFEFGVWTFLDSFSTYLEEANVFVDHREQCKTPFELSSRRVSKSGLVTFREPPYDRVALSSNGVLTVRPSRNLEFPHDLKAYTFATITSISLRENRGEGEVTTNDSRKQRLKIFDLRIIKNYLNTAIFVTIDDKVLVELKGRKILNIIAAPVIEPKWKVAVVTKLSENSFEAKVLNTESTLQVRNDKLDKFELPVSQGDVLAILPGQDQMSKLKKPFGSKAKIICSTPKSAMELRDFLQKTETQIMSGQVEVFDVLRNTNPWRFVVQMVFNQNNLMLELINTLMFVVKEGKPQPGLIAKLLNELVFKTDLFTILENLAKCIVNYDLLMKFLKILRTYVPKAETKTKSLKRLMIEHELQGHPRKDKILQLIDSLNGETEESMKDDKARISRKSFAIAPVSFPNCKLEHISGLEAVKLGSPFADSEEYLDIFYRLVSASFHSINVIVHIPNTFLSGMGRRDVFT